MNWAQIHEGLRLEFSNWERMGKIGIANSRRIGAANSRIGCEFTKDWNREFAKDWNREFTNWGRFYEGLGLRIHELWAANSRKV
jgi:hypothetical protein